MNAKKLLFAFLAILILAAVGCAGYFLAVRKAAQPAEKSAQSALPASSSTAQAVSQTPDYCFGGKCFKENATGLFKDMFGSVLDSAAPSNAGSYLTSVISPVYFDDGWFNNCAPLKQKVSQLIAGKTSDSDKISAIANWVAKSRPYGVLPAGKINSVCALFSANSGSSEDAAVVTVAMLKAAGITARVAIPETGSAPAREYASVLLDGKWVAIDGTFGEGQRNIFTPTALLSGVTYRAFEKPEEIIIASGNKFSSDFTYYLADGIFTTTYIVTDLAYDSGAAKSAPHGTITYLKPAYSSYDVGAVDNATLTVKDTKCGSYNCVKTPGTDTVIQLPKQYTMIRAQKVVQASGGKIVSETDGESVTPAGLVGDYYVSAGLPPGNYRLAYRSSFGKLVAYSDFELKPSDNLVLTPGMFSKGDGVDDTQFQGFVSYLESVGK